MILNNPNLTNIRIDISTEELVNLIRIHLRIDHFCGINQDGRIIESSSSYDNFYGGVRLINILGRPATEYEIEAQKVCDFLLQNLEDNLNVKSSTNN